MAKIWFGLSSDNTDDPRLSSILCTFSFANFTYLIGKVFWILFDWLMIIRKQRNSILKKKRFSFFPDLVSQKLATLTVLSWNCVKSCTSSYVFLALLFYIKFSKSASLCSGRVPSLSRKMVRRLQRKRNDVISAYQVYLFHFLTVFWNFWNYYSTVTSLNFSPDIFFYVFVQKCT